MENKENVSGLTDPIIDISAVKKFSSGIDKLVENENSLVEKIKVANRSIKSVIDCIETINYIKNHSRLNSIRFFNSVESSYGYRNFYCVDHKVMCQMLDVFKLSCEKDLAERKKKADELIAKCSSKLHDEQA